MADDSPPSADNAPIAVPEVAPRASCDWAYIVAMLALVAAAIALLEWTYQSAPIPPGVDPGDWIARSRAYVGLPFPPFDAIGSVYLYPPGIFPILGILDRLTSNPALTGYIFGGFLLGTFGLSVIHLARRYFRLRPLQLLFVGLAVFNGTTISMLYWGGYPNFLGFVFFNETIIFFYAFLRSGAWRDAILLSVAASLTYLTHTLTFVLLAGTIGLAIVFLLILGPSPWRRLISRPMIAGAAIVAGTILAYTEITRALGIPHPSYFYSNPPAFIIDNLGELFMPLGTAPTFFPAGSSSYLPSTLVLGLLIVASLVLAVALVVARRLRPAWVGQRATIATAWLVTALLAPAGGYLLHVETVYTRFVYFLPLPLLLLAGLYVEQAILPKVAAMDRTPEPAPEADTPPLPPRAISRRNGGWVANAAVLVVLVLVIAGVSIPTMISSEASDASTTHGAQFVEAANWLTANPRTGAVLAHEGTVRWVEALTNRGAFDIGPTWLLFEPWQIVNAQESYFAFNSQVGLTNNVATISYSGTATSVVSQSPMYSVFFDGVTVPIVRALPAALSLNITQGGSTHSYAADAFSPPILTAPASSNRTGTVGYAAPSFSLVQQSTVAAKGGGAWINYTATPVNGSSVSSLSLTLSQPPVGDPLFHTPSVQNLSYAGGRLTWDVGTTLGLLPGQYPVNNSIGLTPAPSKVTLNPAFGPTSAALTFTNPQPTLPLQVSIEITTQGANNPAVQLPSVMDTPAFLVAHDIHFVLLPTAPQYTQTINYYEAEFGFRVGFSNSGWTVLEG